MSKNASKTPKKAAEKQKPRKTYLFRIYPSHKQTQTLEKWLGWCCEVYNAALDERKSAYRLAGVYLSYEHQCAELPYCEQVGPQLYELRSNVITQFGKLLHLAFHNPLC